MISPEIDKHYMQSAISLARRGVGRTAENPSVGCVVVKDEIVIARNRTADGGRPHAETQAFEGVDAYGATLYVTLEPCTHHGKTPPCVDAVISSGVKRVVIGALDVDPRVGGKSIAKLQNAGIDVVQGVCEEQCLDVIKGFRSRYLKNKPWVTLKMACSLDGEIALSNGHSQWITGEAARNHTHIIRSNHDAILVGIGTALADDPQLTTRLDGVDHTSLRVILDSKGQLKQDSALVRSAQNIPLLIMGALRDDLKGAYLENAECDTRDLTEVLSVLAKRGVNNLLVEGGAKIHASFIKSRLCDELLLYRAPTVLGGDAISAVSDLGLDNLDSRYDFYKLSARQLGEDMLETYRLKSKG